MEDDAEVNSFRITDESKMLTSTLVATMSVDITILTPNKYQWQYQIKFPYEMMSFLKRDDQYPWLTMPVVYGTVKYDSESEAHGAAQDHAVKIVREYEQWLHGLPYRYTYPFKIPIKYPGVEKYDVRPG